MHTRPDHRPNEVDEFSDPEVDENSEDYTSSSGSSSESSSDDDNDDEDDDELDSGPIKQPQLLLPSSTGRTGTLPASGLSSRLASFLPSLRAANESLQREREQLGQMAHNIEIGEDEDEPHVDMNLGLGVLEQVGGTDSDGDGVSSSEAESTSETGEPEEGCQVGSKRKTDVLDNMLGRKKRSRPSIEVVAGAVPTDKEKSKANT